MSKCCIFDLDGTILDTITTITYYVNKTMESEGIPPITEDECKYFAGNGARLLIERTLASKGISDEGEIVRILDIYKKMYDEEPLYLTKPFDGIMECLLRLKEAGYKLGVVSNKPHTAALPVVKHFFGDMIDVVSGALDGVPIKPAPDIPARVLRELGSTPEECAFVGDTYVDMETGKNLGAAKSIGVLWGFRKREELVGSGATAIASTMDELYEAVTDVG